MRLFSAITAPFRAAGRALGGAGVETSLAAEPERREAPVARPATSGATVRDAFDRSTSLAVPPGERVVFQWKASKPTFHVHWWPLKEQNQAGGDPTENLFAKGGPLDKYDALFGTSSREREYKNRRIPLHKHKSDEGWAGHCNNAAQVACLLDPPTKERVTLQAGGRQVTFTRRDLEGLLVIASANLMAKTEQVGKRNFGGVRSVVSMGDLSPNKFLRTLQDWARQYDRPFALDTDPSKEVWNYPYDEVLVTERYDGRRTFQLSGTGFPEDKLKMYAGTARKFLGGEKSVWLANESQQSRPDFMWRPIPAADPWHGPAKMNPRVDMAQVKQIYDAFEPATPARLSLAA